tara:strand:- start:1101 stop:1796 length:696 start_codon:yes stop_codon:yes gene_type:complete
MADFTFAHREEGFDDHIENSIRGYSNLLSDIVRFSRYFVEDCTNIVDIGCSTGKFTEMLIEENNEHCAEGNYVGVEIAEGFYSDLDDRYLSLYEQYPEIPVNFIKDDIRNYQFHNCSLVTSIFTLQFMPPRNREEVIQKIYNGLNKGGAFIFAEKTVCNDARLQDMLTFNYYDYKRKSFTTEDIMDKEKTLRHMMKPNTWDELQSMLTSAGFSKFEIFWKNYMFIGVIAIK